MKCPTANIDAGHLEVAQRGVYALGLGLFPIT
jgi:hypothetical protein